MQFPCKMHEKTVCNLLSLAPGTQPNDLSTLKNSNGSVIESPIGCPGLSHRGQLPMSIWQNCCHKKKQHQKWSKSSVCVGVVGVPFLVSNFKLFLHDYLLVKVRVCHFLILFGTETCTCVEILGHTRCAFNFWMGKPNFSHVWSVDKTRLPSGTRVRFVGLHLVAFGLFWASLISEWWGKMNFSNDV